MFSPNLVMEEPAFLSELGDPAGLRMLDLGCGDGSFGARCVAAGCASYLGVDGSIEMIDHARRHNSGPGRDYRVADLEDFEAEPSSVDVVTSRMALHYVEDIGPVLRRAHTALVPGGRLLISVLHPVISAGNAPPEGPRTSQVVDDYFAPGPRERLWFDSPTTWHHRTVEHNVGAVTAAGFGLDTLRECEPVEALFDGDRAEYARRLRVPLFLLLGGHRPS